jgi:hypothetical protein
MKRELLHESIIIIIDSSLIKPGSLLLSQHYSCHNKFAYWLNRQYFHLYQAVHCCVFNRTLPPIICARGSIQSFYMDLVQVYAWRRNAYPKAWIQASGGPKELCSPGRPSVTQIVVACCVVCTLLSRGLSWCRWVLSESSLTWNNFKLDLLLELACNSERLIWNR